VDLLTSLQDRLGHDAVARLSVFGNEEENRGTARVHVTSNTVLVGPWNTTDQVHACGECVRLRWLRVRSASERTLRAADGQVVVGPAWPIDITFVVDATQMLLDRVADERWRDPGGQAPEGCAFVTALDLGTLRTRTILIEREPLCPNCSVWEAAAPDEPVLQSRPSGGGSRRTSVEDYDLLEDALLNEWSGVLGAGATEDLSSPTTAPVFGRFDSRSTRRTAELSWSGQTPSYGRSRIVGILEGLERYAGSFPRRPIQPLVAAYDELECAVDPRVLGLYDPHEYVVGHGLEPFDPGRPIPWVWAYSMRDRRPILIASRNVFYGGTSGSDRFVDECSNGCASGSCYEEAVLHGLLEVIERDAFLMAWYGRRALPSIAVGHLGAVAATLVDRAGLLGYDIDLLDTTSDVGVPVVTAVGVKRDGGDGYLVLASGAALDPEEAAVSALSEVLTYLPGRATQTARRRSELEAMAADFSKVTSLRDHAELFGLPRMGVLGLELRDAGRVRVPQEVGCIDSWSGDLALDLSRTVTRLADLGHDVVVVDQTTPEQARRGVCAVRVVVPGLLPIDFGWSRQRALRMPRLLASTDQLRLVPHPFP
jgi:ribosomal protein S12 methylthiotransferase accessory factor